MAKSKSISNFFKISLILIILLLAGILVGCGSKEASQITLALEDSSKTAYLPGETVDFTITSDGEFDINEVELVVTNGGEYVTIMGQSIKINEDAIPGTTITVQAEYKDLVSNIVPFSIAHIEAEEIEISSEKDKFYASEIFDLSVSYFPVNATRQINLEIIEGGDKAKIIDNKVSISSTANEGDIIKVVASMGEKYSDPFVIEVSSQPDFVSIKFDQPSMEIDSSTDNLVQPVSVKGVFLEEGKTNEIYTNAVTLTAENTGEYVDAGYDVIKIIDDLYIKAMNKGSAKITASYNKIAVDMSIDVYMTPDQIKVPENFNKVANFNYQISKPISFKPSILEAHGNKDLRMFVVGGGDNSIVFESKNGEWSTKDTTNTVLYDGSSLIINKIGNYEIYFQSISGCLVETTSPSVEININNAINVSNKEEFANAIINEKEFNIVNDIIFEDGKENYVCYGDKKINGNGFTIDLSGQLTEKESAYGWKFFIEFKNDDPVTPYTIEIQDLSFVGNMGLLSTEEFAEYKGVTTDVVEQKLTTDSSFIIDNFYRGILYINSNNNIDTSKPGPYSYAIPVLKNISFKKCNCGIRIENAIDEVELGKENARPAVDGLSFSNMFGDGIVYIACQINITNLNIGTVGGSAITSGGSDAIYQAGENRNEQSYGNFYGNLTCDNVTDGTTLFTIAQLNTQGNIAAVFNALGGLSGAIQMVITQKTTELLKPYVDTDREAEVYQTLQKAKSNILRQGSKNTFNLLCFTRNGVEDILFDEINSSLIVDFNDEFLYNGIDTTHKFIRVNVYDILMSIDTLGQSIKKLLEQYADAIKPIMVYVTNFNYQGN